jgi:hypothetical protein
MNNLDLTVASTPGNSQLSDNKNQSRITRDWSRSTILQIHYNTASFAAFANRNLTTVLAGI